MRNSHRRELRNGRLSIQDIGLEALNGLEHLSTLTHLDLAQNRLSSVPPTSGNNPWDALTGLKLLSIQGNSFTSLQGRYPHAHRLL